MQESVEMQDETGMQGARREPNAPAWLERACIIVPAYDAEATLGGVVGDLRQRIPELGSSIIVVDDGSSDATDAVASDLGCTVVGSAPGAARERKNVGKGAALRAGFEAAHARRKTVALTVDADGQHPAEEARRVLLSAPSEAALVLGIRDLVGAGAPRANRFSNGISNYFLSRFAGRELLDTQCGLRRYPIRETLALGAHASGYDFEAEVLLRAVWTGMEIIEQPVRVVYPEDRETHFRVARDPWLILRTVLASVGSHWLTPSRSRAHQNANDGETG